MAVKTVTLRLEAYDRLRAARAWPGESFSQVILRATWPERSVTARQLLAHYQEHGSYLTEAELDAVEAVIASDVPVTDKWTA